MTVLQMRRFSFISIVWIFNSSMMATSMTVSGSSRRSIGNAPVRPPSSLRASDILDSSANSQSIASERSEKRQKTAVVVGGGPGGLAVALVLSNVKKPGSADDEGAAFFERIIVLDEAPKVEYDASRSYFFNINGRGQKFTKAYNIDLTKRGTPSTKFAVQYVPSDPQEIFDGGNPVFALMTDEEDTNLGTQYWVPRNALIEMMTDEICSRNNEKNRASAIIEFRRGVRCEYIEPTTDNLVKIATGNEDFIVTDLCVGADGVSSKVRQSLEEGRFVPEKWSNAKNPSKNFRLKKYKSPSTGLRVKGLRIDSKFAIPERGDSKTEVPIDSSYSYVLQSATTGPFEGLKLSVFPQKNPDPVSGRPINIVVPPCHDIWDPNKIRTDDGGRSAKAYFKEKHPRFDWDKIVPDAEWERFASSKGSTFPPCQYSPSMYVSSKSNRESSNVVSSNESDGTGVALTGDALHSFPPDLGLGVNVAMYDALVLGEAFKEAAASSITETDSSKTPMPFVSKALKLYQEKNGRETRALIALTRCGAPYQYPHLTRINRFRKFFWSMNLLLRLVLNKVTLGFSPRPALLMQMNPDTSFHTVMKKANTLTAVLWSTFFGFCWFLIRSRIAV